MQTFIFVTIGAWLIIPSNSASTDQPEEFVDVLAGTDMDDGNSDGNTLPQVKRPWGFNDWVPQTTGFGGSRWFHRKDTLFQGMRCTHQPSPWIGDYSYITIQPHLGASPLDLQYTSDEAIFRPYLFKANLTQRSSPLRSSVEPILFELTPTSRAAALRVTFPASGPSKQRVPRISVQGGEASAHEDTITGFTTSNSGGVPNDWKMYFVLRATGGVASSDGSTGTFEFENARGSSVNVVLATSFISVEQAAQNLEQEIGSRSFDAILAEGRSEWRSAMGRVQVETFNQQQLRIFNTNLWKSMLFPRFIHETTATGDNIHMSPYTGQVTPGRLVADSGFWDAYHTVYPLQSVVFPDKLGMLMEGWVNAYKEAGWLPTWASPGQRNSMVATMGDVSLADAIVKSKLGFVSGFDVEEAYKAIRKDAFEPGVGNFGRTALNEYVENGYIPIGRPDYGNQDTVAETLNYYAADAAIARAAEALGKTDDQAVLQARSMRYRTLFNDKSQFFQPKEVNGAFLQEFDDLAWGNGFTEGGAWQYRFYLPHDVDGLKALYRGSLCDKISQMLTSRNGESFHPGSYGYAIHEMTELAAIHRDFGLYSHNNQPSHEVLWIAKKAGCNKVADKYLRQVMQELYTEDGWSGDEDNGEMASWYILSALGIYSLEGAKDELVIGSPAVVHATVRLSSGATLTISTSNQSESNVYVQSAKWTPTGGHMRAITGNVIKYSELMGGGELSFTLGDKPRETENTDLKSSMRKRQQGGVLPVTVTSNGVLRMQ